MKQRLSPVGQNRIVRIWCVRRGQATGGLVGASVEGGARAGFPGTLHTAISENSTLSDKADHDIDNVVDSNWDDGVGIVTLALVLNLVLFRIIGGDGNVVAGMTLFVIHQSNMMNSDGDKIKCLVLQMNCFQTLRICGESTRSTHNPTAHTFLC